MGSRPLDEETLVARAKRGDVNAYEELPHTVLFVAPDGLVRDDQGWLAGNTLLVDRGGTTVRVKGELDRRGAVALVRAMRW